MHTHTKGRHYSFDAPYIWALPVWGGGGHIEEPLNYRNHAPLHCSQRGPLSRDLFQFLGSLPIPFFVSDLKSTFSLPPHICDHLSLIIIIVIVFFKHFISQSSHLVLLFIPFKIKRRGAKTACVTVTLSLIIRDISHFRSYINESNQWLLITPSPLSPHFPHVTPSFFQLILKSMSAILAIFGHLAIGPCATNSGKWGIPEKNYKNVLKEKYQHEKERS